jgi:hypothetical protein
MRASLIAALTLALAMAAGAPSAVATGEPGSECEGNVPTVRVECPRVISQVTSVKVARRAALVEVDVSSAAVVNVFGQVSWQVRRQDGSKTGLIQGISSGGPRAVEAGPTTFRVRLGKTVLRRLGRIAPRQFLRARMTVFTTDLAGRESERVFRVKLHGRDPA